MLVNGKKKHLSVSADQEKWDLDQEIAAGLIALTLELGQHVHIQGLEDDLVKMWEALCHVYVQQQAGTHFNAYDILFNIQKQPDETLQSLITQVTTAMQLCQNLCPSDGSYTLVKQDEELVITILIRALPAEFDSFTSALFLQNNIDKTKVIKAFVTEESNRLHHSNQSAMLTNRQIAPSTSTQTPSKWCNFCDSSTHNTDACFSLANAKKLDLEHRQTAKQEKKQRKKDQKVQQANTGVSPSPPEAEATGSAFTIASLSSHLSAHIVPNASCCDNC